MILERIYGGGGGSGQLKKNKTKDSIFEVRCIGPKEENMLIENE